MSEWNTPFIYGKIVTVEGVSPGRLFYISHVSDRQDYQLLKRINNVDENEFVQIRDLNTEGYKNTLHQVPLNRLRPTDIKLINTSLVVFKDGKEMHGEMNYVRSQVIDLLVKKLQNEKNIQINKTFNKEWRRKIAKRIEKEFPHYVFKKYELESLK